MKKILFSLAVLLALGSSAPADAQRHRHTPRTTVVDKEKAQDAKADDEDVVNGGITAFSDTSSVAKDTAFAIAVYRGDSTVNDSNRYDPSRFDDPFSWIGYLCSSSFWGNLFVFGLLLLFLLFLFLPLIIVLLIIRYFVRRHNDRVRLAEKAMEQGRPLTDEEMLLSKKSPDYMWRRGVRNVSIGIGLAIFLWCLGAESLAGIGGLVACLGAGQMFMVCYNYNSQFGRSKKDAEHYDGFDDFSGDISDLKFDEEDKKDK